MTSDLHGDKTAVSGKRALSTLLELAEDCFHSGGFTTHQVSAALGVIRGTGPGASFSRLVESLEQWRPPRLTGPFEGAALVQGHVWRLAELLGADDPRALLKLSFSAGAVDLPLHTHPHSDRCLIVLEGRGFFHVSDRKLDDFASETVSTTAVRKRDVIAFPRGTVHTFSAPRENLVLLSAHFPYIPLDDPEQYALAAPLTKGKDLFQRDEHHIEAWMESRGFGFGAKPLTSRCTARVRPS